MRHPNTLTRAQNAEAAGLVLDMLAGRISLAEVLQRLPGQTRMGGER